MLGIFRRRALSGELAGRARDRRPAQCRLRPRAAPKPAVFETTQSGEVFSRLTTDTTLVQTVVGSSLSMGLRNAVVGTGAIIMLVWTNPRVMAIVLLMLVVVVLPALWIGRRVRRLSRASQDRVADSSAIAAEILNAVPVVQAMWPRSANPDASGRRRRTPSRPPCAAPGAGGPGGLHHHRQRSLAAVGLYQGTQSVLAGNMSAGHLGQTVVCDAAGGAATVLGEVYGDLLRAAGATERLMELLASESPWPRPAPALPQTGQGCQSSLTGGFSLSLASSGQSVCRVLR